MTSPPFSSLPCSLRVTWSQNPKAPFGGGVPPAPTRSPGKAPNYFLSFQSSTPRIVFLTELVQ